MSVLSAALAQLVCLGVTLVLYFGMSPKVAALFGMFLAGTQALAHGVVWWIAERRR